MLTIGINGFGRIGRTVLRAALGNPAIRIAAVNDLTDASVLAHLLSHDSIYGKLPASVEAADSAILVNGERIAVHAERDPAAIPWAKEGVDLVVESTGRFTEKAKAEVHITSGGAKRVLISAPAKGDDLTVVMGVNEGLYESAKHFVVSNGSCTTNALAPIVSVVMLTLAYLVVGVVVVEVVFSFPGMGKLMVDGVAKRDIPLVQACGLLFASVYIMLNLLADVLAVVANPRLRHPR